MGQYHITVNLDKQQFLFPHKFGDGLKLREQTAEGGILSAIHYLLAASNGRGGGDYHDNPIVGSWAGDRIAIIGDYVEPNDVPGYTDKDFGMCEDRFPLTFYNHVLDHYEDISEVVRVALESEYGIRYQPPRYSPDNWDAWLDRVDADSEEVIEKEHHPDMILFIPPDE